MRETSADLVELQRVLDASDAAAGTHLRRVITPDRRITAGQLCERLTGMRLLALATSTRDGRPLVAPVDGFFYRGEFWFGSAPDSLRMRHITVRPDVSATHIDGEPFAVTVHGTAHLEGTVADLRETGFGSVARDFYGEPWLEWGAEAVYARIAPRRMYTFQLE